LRSKRMIEPSGRLMSLEMQTTTAFITAMAAEITRSASRHIIFPEIDYDKVADVWGMDITVCTSAKCDAEARALLSAFNFPFRQ